MNKDKNSNLLRASFEELIKLGYKQVEITKDKKGNVNPPNPGALLCLLNKEKSLWAELDRTDIKMSKITPDKFLILEK